MTSFPTMLVPCSVGGWRRIIFVTRATGGVSWEFDTCHPPGERPTERDMQTITRLVECEVDRRQAKWRRAQKRRRAA